MLYPKKDKTLTVEEFKNPGCEYRAAPFWAWNNRLDKDELTWQIEQLKKLGYGGFHMHVRTGMATEYLSDEYIEIVRACVEKARGENMLAWLYDEDRWPSGAAGGLVTRQEQYRIRHLLLTRHPYGSASTGDTGQFSSFSAGRSENGKLVACFDVELDSRGDLKSYRRIGEGEEARNIRLYAYLETALPNPWYNNQTYVNTLDKAAMKEFIRVTYEPYGKNFAPDFGGLVPAIFTDEPQFSQKGTLHYAREDRDVALPWADDIANTFSAAYGGENLIDGLPELLWDLPEGRISLLRYHYHDHITERFAQAFADQCGSWCADHGLMLTGHMVEEPTLESQTQMIGEAMRSYRSFQLPGIDMLCDWREYTTAKQAQSAARQYGCPGVLSELYGVTNWDFDFRGHKLQGDWQAALGVTVRVPHLSWVSMNGEAKRDYPSSFNYQSPWYEEYPYVEDHFARVAAAMTRGKPVVHVGVLHPIESYWLHWGARENTQTIREQMDKNFQDLCNWLLRGLIDFDYICESTLPSLCNPAGIGKAGLQAGAGPGAASRGEPQFPVGKMAYDVIIVPGMETIRGSTLDRLEAFSGAGGRIIFLGDAPKYADARPDDRGRKLWEASEHIGFERLPLLSALEGVREIGIRDGSGAEVGDLFYQLREEAGPIRWLFIAHADKPVNPDIPAGRQIRISLRGAWAATLYNTLNGEIGPLQVGREEGGTTITCPFYEHDSLLLKLDTGAPLIAAKAPSPVIAAGEFNGFRVSAGETPCIRFTEPVPVILHEPNVLLLDIAEYAVDDDAYRPAEEILRLDNRLRQEFGWPLRGDAVAQPWVEHDTSIPHTLRLRYTFASEIPITGAELALENAAVTTVSLNGKRAAPVEGWYVDRCIGRVRLPEIQAGTNVLELALPYGRKTDPEALYVLGNFGVRTAGSSATLTVPVSSLAFGDITRQGLPFYGGNITYHLDFQSSAAELEIAATCYRGHLLRVQVDGEDRGVIAYSPYRLKAAGLKGSSRRVDILYFGSRINTFGQLHANIRDPGFWWGPNSWRLSGPAWTYEYRFWPQGVLKSPEIREM
ncbi:MAG: hypothetical protein LBL56_01160 [Treponema sp.]|jgi:hypothetical protein|nr:hypothetical protein [Treponema sp.]